jgi:hypothetical protein
MSAGYIMIGTRVLNLDQIYYFELNPLNAKELQVTTSHGRFRVLGDGARVVFDQLRKFTRPAMLVIPENAVIAEDHDSVR